MGSAILMSIIVVTIVAPAIAARDPRPRRGLARALLMVAAFGAVWLLLVILYARLTVPEIPPP